MLQSLYMNLSTAGDKAWDDYRIQAGSRSPTSLLHLDTQSITIDKWGFPEHNMQNGRELSRSLLNQRPSQLLKRSEANLKLTFTC